MSKRKAPENLLEAVRYFADEDIALAFVADLLWPDGKQVCPHCGSVEKHYFLKTRRVWKCRDCRKQFSVKKGTIFEDSPIPFSKWLPALWQIANCKNGISSYELARAIGVTQKTAWFMLHRIRLAMQSGNFDKLSGEVEADETFIGGELQNMHRSKRKKARKVKGGAKQNKMAVMGMIERGDPSRVRASVLRKIRNTTVGREIRKNVEPGSALYTDALNIYRTLRGEYEHDYVDHSTYYVRGRVHTNTMENFWSCLKRTLKGTYISIEPFHLFRYLDEQVFRFNARKDTDSGRFLATLMGVIAKRLTYAELTGSIICPKGAR